MCCRCSSSFLINNPRHGREKKPPRASFSLSLVLCRVERKEKDERQWNGFLLFLFLSADWLCWEIEDRPLSLLCLLSSAVYLYKYQAISHTDCWLSNSFISLLISNCLGVCHLSLRLYQYQYFLYLFYGRNFLYLFYYFLFFYFLYFNGQPAISGSHHPPLPIQWINLCYRLRFSF